MDGLTVDNIDENQLLGFKEAFAVWDEPNKLTCEDLGYVFQSIGLNIDSEELRGFQKDLDCGGESQGCINFPKLLDTIGSHLQAGFTDTEQDLLDAFKLFDTKNTGVVDVEELRQLFLSLGGRTEEEVNEMLTVADEQRTGKIRYYTFVKSMFLR